MLTSLRGECTIEEPTQQSVAALRNSLFGGSSASLEQMFSRGMGGTLSASPVVLRKKQMTERRQVVSSVEVSKQGMVSMSMTQMFRMERKSESDATVSELSELPTYRLLKQIKISILRMTYVIFISGRLNK